jgi:hypothetical protein
LAIALLPPPLDTPESCHPIRWHGSALTTYLAKIPYRINVDFNASNSFGSSEVIGSRNSPVSRPSNCIADFTGIGFVANDNMSRHNGNNLWCNFAAPTKSPLKAARTIDEKYQITVDEKLAKSAVVRESKGKRELVLPLPSVGTPIEYYLRW